MREFVETALILEEIAIDMLDEAKEKELLQEAEGLHLQSLELSRKAFGELNVQTAKHYGNLGRLYQSMKQYTVRTSAFIATLDPVQVPTSWCLCRKRKRCTCAPSTSK